MGPLALLVSGMVVQAQALGAFVSGEALLRNCVSSRPYEAADCLGYVTGIADAIGAAEPVLHDRFGIPPVVCVRPGVTRGQIRDVVVAHLHQEASRGQGAGFLVVEALMQAFPCPGAGDTP